jgi:hypothetical protein
VSAGYLPAEHARAVRVVELAAAVAGNPEVRTRVAVTGAAALHLCDPRPRRLTDDLDLVHRAPAAAASPDEAADDAVELDGALNRGFGAGPGSEVMRWSQRAATRWHLPFSRPDGARDAVRVDLIRVTPELLWPTVPVELRVPGGAGRAWLAAADPHEAAGSKVATVFLRQRSRDLFDAHHLLTRAALDPERLRLSWVLGVAGRPLDPRGFTPERAGLSEDELRCSLAPLLPAAERERAGRDPGWGRRLLRETREALAAVLPLAPHEREFVARLRDLGQLEPELLTGDAEVAARIRRRPELVWWRDHRVRAQ